MILVDTGSTDNTAAVARTFGFKVEEVGDRFRHVITKEEYDGINEMIDLSEGYIVKEGDTLFDYSAARNYAASLASNDFVAMPDCDEAYTRFDIDALNGAIESGAHQLAYQFVYAHDKDGNAVVQFEHSKFYDRTKMKWVGIIHEVLSGEGAYTNAMRLPVSVIKLEHWQNEETNRKHYLTGLALSCYLDPKNDRNSHYFGRELMYRHHPISAIRELKRHIAMGAWPVERSQSMIYIGDCYKQLGNPMAMLDWYMRAFFIAPNRREPLMRIAEHYYEKQSPDHVIPLVTAALSIVSPDDFYGNFQPYYEAIPHEMMYWALWQKGLLNDARAHFDACLGYEPFNPKYLEAMRWFYPLPNVSVVIHGEEGEAMEATKKSIDALVYPKECMDALKKDPNGWSLHVEAGKILDPFSVISAYKIALDNRKNAITFNGDEKTYMIADAVSGKEDAVRKMNSGRSLVREWGKDNALDHD